MKAFTFCDTLAVHSSMTTLLPAKDSPLRRIIISIHQSICSILEPLLPCDNSCSVYLSAYRYRMNVDIIVRYSRCVNDRTAPRGFIVTFLPLGFKTKYRKNTVIPTYRPALDKIRIKPQLFNSTFSQTQ